MDNSAKATAILVLAIGGAIGLVSCADGTRQRPGVPNQVPSCVAEGRADATDTSGPLLWHVALTCEASDIDTKCESFEKEDATCTQAGNLCVANGKTLQCSGPNFKVTVRESNVQAQPPKQDSDTETSTTGTSANQNSTPPTNNTKTTKTTATTGTGTTSVSDPNSNSATQQTQTTSTSTSPQTTSTNSQTTQPPPSSSGGLFGGVLGSAIGDQGSGLFGSVLGGQLQK